MQKRVKGDNIIGNVPWVQLQKMLQNPTFDIIDFVTQITAEEKKILLTLVQNDTNRECSPEPQSPQSKNSKKSSITNDYASKMIQDSQNIFNVAQKDSYMLLSDAEFLLYAMEYLKVNPSAKAKQVLNLRRRRFRVDQC